MANTPLEQAGSPTNQLAGERTDGAGSTRSLVDCALFFVERWKLLVFGPLLTGLMARGIAFATPPSFTVREPDDNQRMEAQTLAIGRPIELLGAPEPTGRIVLQMTPQSSDLPDLALEDGEPIYVAARPTAVGVFGSVLNAVTYLHSPGRTIDDYLRLAGGATKAADEGSVFIGRANGNVTRARQRVGLLSKSRDLLTPPAESGDTRIIPEELNKTVFVQSAKEWTQILLHFRLGIAVIKGATP